MVTKAEKKLEAEAKVAVAEAKAEAKEAEAEVKEENKKKKIVEEFFAGKLVLKKYENADGKFVVLEGGETIKL